MCDLVTDYSSYVVIIAPDFWRYLKNQPPFEMKFSQLSFVVYIYIYTGLTQSTGSKNQRYTFPLKSKQPNCFWAFGSDMRRIYLHFLLIWKMIQAKSLCFLSFPFGFLFWRWFSRCHTLWICGFEGNRKIQISWWICGFSEEKINKKCVW